MKTRDEIIVLFAAFVKENKLTMTNLLDVADLSIREFNRRSAVKDPRMKEANKLIAEVKRG